MPSEFESSGGETVLVVEDDRSFREALKLILENAGFDVTAVEDGLSAYRELERRPYRAILCDIKMPFLGGKGFYEQLEEKLPAMASRVIFLSGWTGEPSTRDFLELSGRPYFQKPADFKGLVRTVEQVAGRRA